MAFAPELFIDGNVPNHPDGPDDIEPSAATFVRGGVEQAPAWSVGVRMAPLHTKRKFWWELIFISLLLFLVSGVSSQRKREDVAAAQAALARPIATLAPPIIALVPPIVALAPVIALRDMAAPLALK